MLALMAFAFVSAHAATATNSLSWNTTTDRVSANLHGEALWPLLESIAHQTGWHIFVEPNTERNVDVKFSDLSSGDALHKLLGDLNFAFVPMTNGPSQLYVFTTRMQNATRPVLTKSAVKPIPQKHIPNELMVKLKPGADIDAIAKLVGAKVVGRNDKLGIYLLQFSDAAAADAALGELKNNSDVEDVGYNYVFDPPPTPQTIDNPPVGPTKLTLDSSTQNDPCHPIIGVIDTVPQSLGNNLDQFVMKPVSVVGDVTAPTTGVTHGTAMLSTILTGVSQASGGTTAVKLLPVVVYGSGETTTTWNVALGVQAAVDNGATVLNMSLGGTTDSAVLDDVIQQALAQGVVIFAAAGNQPVNTPTYPAAVTGVNAVTALGAPGQLASYANYGNFVQMALPGASVVYQGNQAYVVQGTSTATAYATGVAAGSKGINCQPWSQIESAMQQKFPVPQK